MTTPARKLPRSLKTRTTSPSWMPRAAASSGCRRSGSRPWIFDRLAVRADIQLAVQPRAGVVGDQQQRVLRGARVAQPLARRQPGGVAGAVGVVEAGDCLREELDLAAGRLERGRVGIGAEIGEEHTALVGRQLQVALGPETVEVGELMAVERRLLAPRLVQMPQPAVRVAPLVKLVSDAEPVGQRGEGREVVAGLRRWRSTCALHGGEVGVVVRAADVVALQRQRAGQHDVGLPRGGRPVRLVHDEGVDARQNARRSLPRCWWWWNGLPPLQ